MINATICTIGDEILIGQILDTNSAYIASLLNNHGIRVIRKISIGDTFETIVSTLREAINNSQLVITTGGLGPTKDDITKKALSFITSSKSFHYNQQQLDYILEICSRRGVELSDLNRDQALVPDNCTVITNRAGTAPGMVFRDDNPGGKTLIISLPGVPYEMEAMMPEVLRTISEELQPGSIIHKTVVTYGMPESVLAKHLEDWENSLPQEIKLAYLPNPSIGIRLRLSVYDSTEKDAIDLINTYSNQLKHFLGDLCYGEGEDTLEQVVSQKILSQNRTLSVAESCTGGSLSSRIVSLAGSSQLYKGGVVAYSNQAKIDILGVDPLIIEKYGAVSRECAEQMALTVKKRYDTYYSVATTGIAGPGGGTADKPVGTVWIAVAAGNSVYSKQSVATGDRQRNIIRFSSEALNFLRLLI